MHDDETEDDVLGGIGKVPTCGTCGSERVVRDAWACWNPETGLWEAEAVFDQEFCHCCDGETRFVWKAADSPPRGAIRELNDALRQRGEGNGAIMVTEGLRGRGADFVRKALLAVSRFDGFSEDNDPYGEHDFGAVEIDGARVFWKIDCYDLTLTAQSPNPANPAVTRRVLTLMLAEEY